MKFGDKLIELRKKNGYSQEELAEKLGVSRQSVSKWESNNTYPETDKIIQIANLFDCSMDDLINDKVTDVESTLRKNKSNVKNIWNSFLSFITNTVDMFSKMKFLEGLKCIILMLILCFILNIGGIIVCNTAAGIISNIFSFLKQEHVLLIREILKSIFHLVWFIGSAIAIIHAFKIKYLNKYEKTNEVKKEIITSNNTKEITTKVEVNENDKPFEFLEVLAKIVIIFIKFIAAWIALGTIFSTLGLVIAFVVVLTYITTNILFLWISLLLLAAIVASILIIILITKFIFNKKVNVLLSIIVFISCVVLAGVSIGLIALSIKNINIVNDNSAFTLIKEETTIDYKDYLVLEQRGVGECNKYKFIVDDSIEENKIVLSRELDKNYFKLETNEKEIDKMPTVIVNEELKAGFLDMYKFFIKNLRENKIYTFENYGNDPLVIKANQNTINKLIENLKIVYLTEEEVLDNEINIKLHGYTVVFKNGLKGEYDAVNDTLTYAVENYSCLKEIEKTNYGDKTVYTCGYAEVIEDE